MSETKQNSFDMMVLYAWQITTITHQVRNL